MIIYDCSVYLVVLCVSVPCWHWQAHVSYTEYVKYNAYAQYVIYDEYAQYATYAHPLCRMNNHPFRVKPLFPYDKYAKTKMQDMNHPQTILKT